MSEKTDNEKATIQEPFDGLKFNNLAMKVLKDVASPEARGVENLLTNGLGVTELKEVSFDVGYQLMSAFDVSRQMAEKAEILGKNSYREADYKEEPNQTGKAKGQQTYFLPKANFIISWGKEFTNRPKFSLARPLFAE